MRPVLFAVPACLILACLSLAATRPATAQDTLKGLGRVHGYTGVAFDTRAARYDILVDASRPEDAAARRYRTLNDAYAAASEGSRDRPTVIGLMPDVYLLTGTLDEPGLKITKDNITLIGLTDDRRKVVIADNRGNMQGASNNGWSLAVDADGFTAINLTFLNYCNVDYDYPGDPSKSLKRRSGTITQALALQAAGDRHVYSHVAFLSRLDTFGNRAARSYFTHVYIEGTDDFVGSRNPSVWEDSEVHFIAGGGILFGGNATFIRSRFRATRPMQFYKALVAPNALIHSTLPNTPLAWHAWRQPPTLNEPSLLFQTTREDGGKPDPLDSAVGTPRRTLTLELTEAQAQAFNPWNLLRWNAEGIDDGWDPAQVRARYEPLGALPFRVTLTNGSPRLRTGDAPAEIAAKVLPTGSTASIRWSTASPFVRLSGATGDRITVTAANTTDRVQVVPIRVSADNGLYATAYVTVDPALIAAPVLRGDPTLKISNAEAHVAYALTLPPGRVDQSRVSWFVCGDASCADAERVAVSRAGKPLKTLPLTEAMSGRHLMATVEPAHDLSTPGPSVRAVSNAPAAAPHSGRNPAVLNLSSVPDTTSPDRWDGDWSLRGAWIPEAPMDGEPRWGLRVGTEPSTLLYTGRKTAGDMDITLTFDTDKLEGQGFGMPGSSADSATLRSDIFFKYDPETRTGYALRMWRTTQASNATMFQVFRITEGRGEPISTQQLTGVLKPTTTIRITVRGRQVSIAGSNTVDRETLSLSAEIEPNRFSGAGLYWPASRNGGSIVLRGLSAKLSD